MDKLISIVTPCYNGEHYVKRYFDSLLRQTYKNFEIIFVNDGSKDKTEEIALSYKKLFEEQNIKFTYLFQENAGQAAAVNNGLKYVNGEYLAWPDSDDFFEDNALEKMLEFLVNHDDYSIVRCKAKMVSESDLTKIVGFLEPKKKNKWKEDLFEDFVIQNDVYFAPGCFMINLKYMREVNPKMEIYCSRGGQNWQILLPVLYKQKCGFIDQYLYNYVVRDNSHSHSIKTLDEIYQTYDVHQELLIHVIKDMNISKNEEKKYLNMIMNKYIKFKYNAALTARNIEESKKNKKILKEHKLLTNKDKFNYLKMLIKAGVKK